MIVVGIGGAGRAVASLFKKFPEYDVFLPWKTGTNYRNDFYNKYKLFVK